MGGEISNIKNYIQIIRPKLVVFNIFIILGILLSNNFRLYNIDYIKLILILLSFQIFYSSVYITNDIIDYETDRLSLRKKHRPIASGKISRKNAVIFSVILIILGLYISLLVSLTLFYFEVFLFIYNILYSCILKKIPYLDTLSNSLTHTLRFILGIILFGIFNQYLITIAIFMLDLSWLLIKRIKELKNHERVNRPIKYYSEKRIKAFWILTWIILLVLYLSSEGLEKTGILWILLIYTSSIILYIKNRKIQEIFEKFAD